MKAYLGITAALFLLLFVAHIWRIVAESAALASDPWFLLTTVVSALLSLWGLRLYRVAARSAG